MRASVDILRVPFERRAIAGFGLGQFALLKIDVAQLRVVMSFVQMMDLGLELLDAFSIKGAGQFKSAGGGGSGAIDGKIVEESRDAKANENEGGPNPFL